MPSDRTPLPLSRRDALRAGGLAALGLVVGCSSDDDSSPSRSTTTSAGNGGDRPSAAPAPRDALKPADFDDLSTCALLPEQTAGPFPLDQQFDRKDITEGKKGHPLRLGLRVVDEGCTPVAGAAVEIWHTDASGDYSAFSDGGGGKDEAEGTTFLRGTQTAGDDGIVEFHTIYPGWYPGRAVHIHVRVRLDDATVLTSQMYFDESYSEAIFATGEYAPFGMPDTSIADDGIAGDAASNGTMLVTTAGETAAGTGTIALLNLGVNPS